MIRGTTTLNVFNTDIDLRGARVYVSYSQGGKVVVDKTNEDIVINENNIEVPLEQEDTLTLQDNIIVKIQMRYVRDNGVAGASNIITTHAGEILKGGVINYE